MHGSISYFDEIKVIEQGLIIHEGGKLFFHYDFNGPELWQDRMEDYWDL